MEVSLRIGEGSPTSDSGRIAAQVVSGIGFLGAGAIMRMGASVRGLTTAEAPGQRRGLALPSVLAYHVEAIATAAVMLLSLGALKKMGRRFKILEIHVSDEDEETLIPEFEDILSKERCDVCEIDVKKDPDNGEMRIQIQIAAHRDSDPPRLEEALTRRSGVLRVGVR
jgi:putative Mg2+ transporter-C (MgtC) family protein